jgi:hypothetical protein
MSDPKISTIVVDIIAINTIWGIINSTVLQQDFSFYMNTPYFNVRFNYKPSYLTLFGCGISLSVLSKYYR